MFSILKVIASSSLFKLEKKMEKARERCEKEMHVATFNHSQMWFSKLGIVYADHVHRSSYGMIGCLKVI